MIVAAAVCPHPPLLIPEVAAGAAHELDDLRAACMTAVGRLFGASPEMIVVLGAGPAGSWDADAGGSLKAYGAPDVHAGGPTDELPLCLTIGAWLLDRVGWGGERAYISTPSYEANASTHNRSDVTVGEERTALLVMADGSAKRTAEAPRHLDDRAAGFDAHIAHALGASDTDSLTALDETLGAELASSGVAPLRALARLMGGARVDATLRYDSAPYGVGYWVADWVVDA